jgi:eukaryotic-like serine/threonine-protein kinase
MAELLQPGQLFAGRYLIEKFLARGGFGAVYVAEQAATELRVALKVLWPHVLFSQDAVVKFQQEARIAGRVNSEHIVRVFDAGFDEATKMPYLVMELLAGEDLDKVVTRRGALPPPEVVAYLRQVASGLDKAHGYVDRHGRAAPIVHRDLKPENLFLGSREDGTPIVKILDFGIAKVLSETTKTSQEIKGTPLYMAYEQAAGGSVSSKTDIWALGLIAFFMLTGKVYWKTANRTESTVAQLFGEMFTQPVDRPSDRLRAIGAPSTLPPGFDDWFLRCVDREPEKRFSTAGEASEALARVFDLPRSSLHSSPVASAATVSGGVLAPSSPAAGAVSQTPSSVAAITDSPALRATDDSLALGATRPRAPKRSGVVGWVAFAAVLVVGVATSAWFLSRRPSTADLTKESTTPGVAPPSAPAAPAALVDPSVVPTLTPTTSPVLPSASAPPSTSAAPRRGAERPAHRPPKEPAVAASATVKRAGAQKEPETKPPTSAKPGSVFDER